MKVSETEMWLRLADRLGMALQECMDKTTSTELRLWMRYLDDEEDKTSRLMWYLIQIAFEVKRANLADPSKLTMEDMVLPFKRGKPMTAEELFEQEEAKEEAEKKKAEDSKSFWLAGLGLTKDGKVKTNPLPLANRPVKGIPSEKK